MSLTATIRFSPAAWPRWLVVLLWVVFGFLVFRVTAVRLLRSGFVRALLMARIGGVSLGWRGVVALMRSGNRAETVARLLIMARSGGVFDVTAADMLRCRLRGAAAEKMMTDYVMGRRGGLEQSFADFCAEKQVAPESEAAEDDNAGRQG